MSHIDVIPTGDEVAHEFGEDCICGPRLTPTQGSDGSIGWIVVHHSLDGREQNE